VYGAPGTGKTRLGVQAISSLRNLTHTNIGHDEIAFIKSLENTVTIHITFANGLALCREEFDVDITTSLLLRALYDMFQPRMLFADFVLEYKGDCANLSFKDLAEFVRLHQQIPEEAQVSVYLHVDEFNHLIPLKLLTPAVSAISQVLSETTVKSIFYVLFSGTSYVSMRTLGASESNPIVELPMNLLQSEG
jgi:hypothetical protein